MEIQQVDRRLMKHRSGEKGKSSGKIKEGHRRGLGIKEGHKRRKVFILCKFFKCLISLDKNFQHLSFQVWTKAFFSSYTSLHPVTPHKHILHITPFPKPTSLRCYILQKRASLATTDDPRDQISTISTVKRWIS